MELSTAVSLIQNGIAKSNQPQVWADFGAGRGLFTKALSTLLAPGSIIHAVDVSKRDLMAITIDSAVHLEKIHADFAGEQPPIHSLDGVLMANSLHFLKDPLSLLQKIKGILKLQGRIIIVEYEMTSSNPWVPHPLGSIRLESLAKDSGLSMPARLAETSSVFNNRLIYAAMLCKE